MAFMPDIKKLIDVCLSHGGLIFGGFVRDYIASIDYNDIDVIFKSVDKLEQCLKELKKTYDVTLITQPLDKYAQLISTTYSYTISSPAMTIKMDCVICRDIRQLKPDMDVNCLYISHLSQNGADIHHIYQSPIKMIVSQIKKREMRLVNGHNLSNPIIAKRIKNFQLKGWKLV